MQSVFYGPVSPLKVRQCLDRAALRVEACDCVSRLLTSVSSGEVGCNPVDPENLICIRESDMPFQGAARLELTDLDATVGLIAGSVEREKNRSRRDLECPAEALVGSL